MCIVTHSTSLVLPAPESLHYAELLYNNGPKTVSRVVSLITFDSAVNKPFAEADLLLLHKQS